MFSEQRLTISYIWFHILAHNYYCHNIRIFETASVFSDFVQISLFCMLSFQNRDWQSHISNFTYFNLIYLKVLAHIIVITSKFLKQCLVGPTSLHCTDLTVVYVVFSEQRWPAGRCCGPKNTRQRGDYECFLRLASKLIDGSYEANWLRRNVSTLGNFILNSKTLFDKDCS